MSKKRIEPYPTKLDSAQKALLELSKQDFKKGRTITHEALTEKVQIL